MKMNENKNLLNGTNNITIVKQEQGKSDNKFQINDHESPNRIRPAPLWGSCRLIYTACACLTTTNLLLMRFNLSFALVCMVASPNNTNIIINDTDPVQLYNGTTVAVDASSAAQRDAENCKLLASTSTSEYDGLGEFEWDKALQGRILGGFFYGYIISQSFGGWFSDKFGGKLFFVLGNLLQSICTLFIPFSARLHPEALFINRILQGIVCGLCLPAMYQLYARWAAPEERTKLMSVAYTGFPLANVIIFPLSSWLCQLDIAGGWPMIFYVTGTFGTICALSYIFLVYDNPNVHPRISAEERNYLNSCTYQESPEPLRVPWRKIAFSGPCWAYNVAHFCQTWCYVTLAVYLPLLMKEMLYFDISSNGLLSALPYVAAFCSRLLIAQCFFPIQRLTRLNLTNMRKVNHLIGTLLPATFILAIVTLNCQEQTSAVALITLTSAFSDLAFTGSYLLSYLDLAPRYAGLLTGISNTIGSLPGVIAPTLIGYITRNRAREEWITVLYVMAAMYLIGGITYAILGSSKLQPWANQKTKSTLVANGNDEIGQNREQAKSQKDSRNNENV